MRIRRAPTALLLLAGILLAGAGPAGADQTVRIRQVDPEGFPNVAVTVSVDASTDPRSIVVTENGVRRAVLNVRPLLSTGQKVDVILAIDVSDSVRGAPLTAALDAARSFVQNLFPGIEAGIVTFSSRTTVVQGLTTDHTALLQAIDRITTTSPGTHLYEAISAAVGMFSGSGQHNLVVLTDGRDVGSSISASQAVRAAQGKKVTIFSVGLGPKAAADVLQLLSQQTRGIYTPAETASLSGVYQQLAGQLSRQYVLLYRSGAAQGAQVTIGVSAASGSDRAIVLLPRSSATPGAPGSGLFSLGGAVGLAVALGLCFLATFLLGTMFLGAAARARRDRELARRMAAPRGPAVEQRGDEEPSALSGWIPESVVAAGERLAQASGLESLLAAKLEQAGLLVRTGEFVVGMLVSAVLVGALGALIFQSVVLGVLFALAGATIPYFLLEVRRNRRLAALHAQLPDILMIMASSMRSGHSFLQAMDMVAKEVGEPGAPEFARVVAEIRLGRPVEEALNALADRVGTEEFRWAITAVNVQREVGGNLAEILDTLAETVREREALQRQIRVLSAEGRLSVKILVALPLLMALYTFRVQRQYMQLLWTTKVGLAMIAIGAVLMLVGIIWARKTVKIDV